MKRITLILMVLAAFMAKAQTDKAIVESTIGMNDVKAHLYFLASDELKGRNTPSPEQEIAALYIRTQLQMAGVKPFAQYPDYKQEVKLQNAYPATEGKIVVGDKSYPVNQDFLVLSGDNGEVTGQVVFAGYGMPDELKKAKVAGKIVVVNAGDRVDQNPQAWFSLGRKKREDAKAQGALALVELYNSPFIPWQVLLRYFGGPSMTLNMNEPGKAPFVHLLMRNSNNEVAPVFQTKKVLATLTIAGKKAEPFSAYNVVGFIEGTDPVLKNEYVVYSAHYDHVGVGRADSTGDDIYNGARDNAVGTSTVLLAARHFGQHPPKRSALFILFTGEEKGLLGSQWYVENSPVPLEKIIYCFNSDNAGYNDTSVATIFGLPRTTADTDIIAACAAFGLEAIDDPAPEQNLFDRSDNVSFAAKGIPAPTFSMGFRAFDAEIYKYYHQPSDSPESLDYDYLLKFFRSYVLAARTIANRPDRPFWKPGDKYYEAGIKLYKN